MDMEETIVQATPVKRQWAMALSNALRAAREAGNNVAVPDSTPLIGGLKLGDVFLGQSPEGAERLAYGERMTSGQGQTLKIRPETLDLAMAMPFSSAGKGATLAGGIVAKVGKAGKAAEAAADALRNTRMSAEEARAAGYWHPIGLGKKLEKPYQEMTYVTEPVKDLPQRKSITLEDLQGQYIVPAVGDRTAAGKLLKEVEGVKFNNPVALEGGPDFMLTHGSKEGPQSTIWASGQPIVSALRNRAVQAEEAGGKANLVYVPMGYDSLNFSTMPVDAALEMIRSGKITKKSKKEFDSAVRGLRPEFAGIHSPEVVEQLHKTGALRHAFLDRMQLDDFQNAGFPHLSSIRKAIMEPSLADVPNYHAGYSVGKIDTSMPINKNPIDPHTTYNTQLHGHVVGGLDEPIPHTMLWRDFFADRRARDTPISGDRMAFERSKPLQIVDQRLLDQVMPYVEALKRQGGQ
jgi:hypothetical protein